MRRIATVLVLVFMGTHFCGSGSAEEEKASSITHEVRFIPDGLARCVAEKNSVFADSRWPDDLDSRRVRMNRIPEKVFTRAAMWLRTMIKPEWLPEDPNAWMIGLQKEYPIKADYLVLRYQIGRVRIQVQENGVAAHVLVDTGVHADLEPGAFLTSVVRKFLRFPEDKLEILQFYLEGFEYEGRTIHYGTMDCDFNRYDVEAYFRRNWYNHTFVWTDGRRAFFRLARVFRGGSRRQNSRPRGYLVRTGIHAG